MAEGGRKEMPRVEDRRAGLSGSRQTALGKGEPSQGHRGCAGRVGESPSAPRALSCRVSALCDCTSLWSSPRVSSEPPELETPPNPSRRKP